MKNEEMCVNYVKDGEVGWTPVVRRRRKKSVRSEEIESSENLNVRDKRRRWTLYQEYIRENLSW